MASSTMPAVCTGDGMLSNCVEGRQVVVHPAVQAAEWRGLLVVRAERIYMWYMGVGVGATPASSGRRRTGRQTGGPSSSWQEQPLSP